MYATNVTATTIIHGTFVTQDFKGDIGIESPNVDTIIDISAQGRLLAVTNAKAKMLSIVYPAIQGSREDLYFQNYRNVLHGNILTAGDFARLPLTVQRLYVDEGILKKETSIFASAIIEKVEVSTVLNTTEGKVDEQFINKYTFLCALRSMSDLKRVTPLS